MATEVLTVSDGTFTLSETKNKNQFYFYRNDGNVLTVIKREPIDLYQGYLMQKMMNGEITDLVMQNFHSEMSDDGKCIRLTVCNIDEKPVKKINSNVSNKKPNFLKRLLHKIFG